MVATRAIWAAVVNGRYSYDVTDKTTTNIISRVGYDGASYTHQGWVTDKSWQTTLVLVSRPASNFQDLCFSKAVFKSGCGLRKLS